MFDQYEDLFSPKATRLGIPDISSSLAIGFRMAIVAKTFGLENLLELKVITDASLDYESSCNILERYTVSEWDIGILNLCSQFLHPRRYRVIYYKHLQENSEAKVKEVNSIKGFFNQDLCLSLERGFHDSQRKIIMPEDWASNFFIYLRAKLAVLELVSMKTENHQIIQELVSLDLLYLSSAIVQEKLNKLRSKKPKDKSDDNYELREDYIRALFKRDKNNLKYEQSYKAIFTYDVLKNCLSEIKGEDKPVLDKFKFIFGLNEDDIPNFPDSKYIGPPSEDALEIMKNKKWFDNLGSFPNLRTDYNKLFKENFLWAGKWSYFELGFILNFSNNVQCEIDMGLSRELDINFFTNDEISSISSELINKLPKQF